MRSIPKKGKERWLNIQINPIFKNNVIVGFTSVAQDITHKKITEYELKTLKRAIEQSPVCVIITDNYSRIEYVNPFFTKITGYTSKEVYSKNPRMFKSGLHDKDFYENILDTILSGKTWDGEIYNKKKNGEHFWAKSIISPIVNKKGDITNFVAIQEDVTYEKLLNEELIEAKEKAEKSNKLKSEFLAQMSHEIRTPLNALINYSDIIKDELENQISSDLIELFDGIEVTGKRIIRTVNAILNMSELQAGTYSVTREEVNIEKIIKNIFNEFKNRAIHKGLDLYKVIETKASSIRTDEFAITQIMSNLVDNAIKYTKSGYVKIILKRNIADNLVIEIHDTGIGISEEYIPHLYDAFTKEQQGYNGVHEGNGLGLALVKKYCEIIGAKVEVKSKKGTGSKFSVIFTNIK